jgi:lysophospholipase L1-like esterase
MRHPLFFFALLLTFGCESSNMTSSPATPMHRYLALGDSYTIGESVAVDERWPHQLVARLRERGVNVATPEIVAKTGWTTDELSGAIAAADPRGPYDLVTLLIGVNNQYRGRDAEQYRGEFTALLRQAIVFAGGDARRVVVVSIPDWGVTPFAKDRDAAKIATEIDRYNTVNREEATRLGAHYVDVTPGSRRAASDAALIAADGLHPSAKMYAEWTALVLPVAEATLRKSR